MSSFWSEGWFWEILLWASVVAAVVALVGVAVVAERRVFLAGGVAHAAYGGVGVAYALGLPPFAGALVVALLGAVGVRRLEHWLGERADTLIGVLWSLGMAIGVLAIDLVPGYAPDLASYLFGSVLLVDAHLAVAAGLLGLATLLLQRWRYRELLAVLFDPEWSRAAGAPVDRYHLVLDVVVALGLMLAMRLVGLILVLALLTVPAALALPRTRSLRRAQALAALLAVLFVAIGLVLSVYLDLRSGAGIVLVSGGAFVADALHRRRAGHEATASQLDPQRP